MPQNLIYQTLGLSNIQNFELKPMIKQKEKRIIPIKMKRSAIRCSQCQQKELAVKGWAERERATPPNNAYGYRDMEYFQLKLFALHKSNDKLIG